jgi:zinc protease
MQEAKPIVEKYFSSLKSKEIPKRLRQQEPDHQGITSYIRQENKRNSLVMFEWVYAAPNHNKGSKHHYYPLQILAEIVGGAETRFLYKKLVEEEKLALDFSCNYYHETLDPYYFSISITLAPGADEKKVKTIVSNYIENLIENGIDESEFFKAQRDLILSSSFSRDGNSTSLNSFSDLAIGLSHEDIDDWVIKIGEVEKKQTEEAAKEILGKKPICVIELYPPCKSEKN